LKELKEADSRRWLGGGVLEGCGEGERGGGGGVIRRKQGGVEVWVEARRVGWARGEKGEKGRYEIEEHCMKGGVSGIEGNSAAGWGR